MSLNIPGYELYQEIGAGGMAEVYRARQLRLDREVALKVMSQRYARDPSFAERFLREARIAANLSHPNIVQIYDVDRAGDTLYLSMEYVRGGDLTQRLRGSLNREVINGIIADLCLALDHAHGKGYVHRDIKPGNILFRENGSLALSDFGIARAIHSDTHMTQTGMVVGTPSYMSPEQALGRALSGQSDLYSVAVIAYQLVTGTLPFQSDSSISVAIKHIQEPVPHLPADVAVMQDFFDRALAKQPETRFASGAAMAQAFREAFAGIAEAHVTSVMATIPRAAPAKPQDSDTTAVLTGTTERHPMPLPRGAHASDTPRTSTTLASGPLQLIIIKVQKISIFLSRAPLSKRLLAGAFMLLITAALVAYTTGLWMAENGRRETALSPAQEARLLHLITGADADVQAGRLIDPAGQNAYEKYLAVLELSPGDPLALEHIAALQSDTTSAIDRALNAGEHAQARELLQRLEVLAPAYTDLQRLRDRFALEQQQREAQLQALIAAAAEAEKAARWQEATQHYAEASSVAPEHKATLTAAASLRQRLLDESQNALQEGRLGDARETLQLLEEHSLFTDAQGEFQALKKRYEAAVARQTFEDTLNAILDKGRAALRQNNLTAPVEDNALWHYQRALKLAPGNSKALQGLQNVHTALANRAAEAIDAQDFTAAERDIESLRALDPQHAEIANLHRDLKIARRDAARAQSISAQVQQLYQRAEIYLQRKQANSADKIFAKIQRLAPRDPGLPALGKKIADGYVHLAQRELDAGDWADVDVWANLGYKHVPDHAGLKKMQHIAAEKRAQQRR